ncbi:hypothetical protein D3C72_1246760 [compost metagenome]
MCAAMMITIENTVGRPTSVVASRMALSRALLSWICCSFSSPSRLKMFSTTITAPSTMMPKSIAPSDSRLAGMPTQVRPMKVESSASGITSATMAAARTLARNRYSTAITSSAPSTRLPNTVCRVLSISVERS